VLSTTPAAGRLDYAEGLDIGHRAYLAAATEPAFWFGHGLGYTTWSYDSIAAEGTSVTVTVTNTGGRPGREVVQVYVSGGAGRALAGWDVVTAAPGETVLTSVFLDERAFQVWDGGGWRTVPGEYAVEAGRHAGDPRLSAIVKM
jgi:beta-glucosidase